MNQLSSVPGRPASDALPPTAAVSDQLRSVAAVLERSFGPARIHLHLRVPQLDGGFQHSSPATLTAPARFVFDRSIALRGTHYGRLSIEIQQPRLASASIQTLLDALADQLAHYAAALNEPGVKHSPGLPGGNTPQLWIAQLLAAYTPGAAAASSSGRAA